MLVCWQIKMAAKKRERKNKERKTRKGSETGRQEKMGSH